MIQNEVNGIITRPYFVPTGFTNALLIEAVAGQIGCVLKYFTGGSCMLIQAPVGTTLSGADLVSYGNTGGYLLGTTESVALSGPARFYLMANGATATVYLLRGMGPANGATFQ